mmetsp:Transcript_13081/g.44712  ORF Transcript_13081/g.44712 Transcript_13081/m.44712 type:complete len:263 (+) Transcript_13081:806-1594(+)
MSAAKSSLRFSWRSAWSHVRRPRASQTNSCWGSRWQSRSQESSFGSVSRSQAFAFAASKRSSKRRNRNSERSRARGSRTTQKERSPPPKTVAAQGRCRGGTCHDEHRQDAPSRENDTFFFLSRSSKWASATPMPVPPVLGTWMNRRPRAGSGAASRAGFASLSTAQRQSASTQTVGSAALRAAHGTPGSTSGAMSCIFCTPTAKMKSGTSSDAAKTRACSFVQPVGTGWGSSGSRANSRGGSGRLIGVRFAARRLVEGLRDG